MKVFGIAIIVLALLIAVVPAFNNCQAEGKAITTAAGKLVPMKCYWSAAAESGVGAALGLLGALLVFSRRRETQRHLAIMGGALGILTMLLPTYLIGVCADMTASCNLIMRPAMLFIGTLVVAISVATLVVAWRDETSRRFA